MAGVVNEAAALTSQGLWWHAGEPPGAHSALQSDAQVGSPRAGQGIPEAEMPPTENSFHGFVVSLLHHDLADRL